MPESSQRFFLRSIRRLPSPSITAHVVDIASGNPTKQLARQTRIREADTNVSHPACGHFIGDPAPAGSFERSDDLEHGRTSAGAQVHKDAAPVFRQEVERGHVAVRKVHHVNEITHSGPIEARVVVSEDIYDRANASGSLSDQRHQVAGRPRWDFPQSGRWCAHQRG
jgi:hypothetical protein